MSYALLNIALHGITNPEVVAQNVEGILREALDLDYDSDLEVTLEEWSENGK